MPLPRTSDQLQKLIPSALSADAADPSRFRVDSLRMTAQKGMYSCRMIPDFAVKVDREEAV